MPSCAADQQRSRQDARLESLGGEDLAIAVRVDGLSGFQDQRLYPQVAHLRLAAMLPLLDHWQEAERPHLRWLHDQAEIEQAVGRVSGGVDAESAAVGWPDGHGGERIGALILRRAIQ